MTDHSSIPTRWSSDALFEKARLYVEQMESQPVDTWQFGLWSSLALELIARASLAHISPVLLADNNDWHHLAHAIGRPATTKKYRPRSIPTSQVVVRLGELVPSFSTDMAGFVTEHASRRDSELHSAELAFEALGTSKWLPKFYVCFKVLAEAMGRTLQDIFSDVERVEQMLDAIRSDAAKSVAQDIAAHKKVWTNMSDDARHDAATQATAWATRQNGHRVSCPSCGCGALVQGSPTGQVERSVKDEDIIERQVHVPTRFECIACGLRVAGLARLVACELGDLYAETSTYAVAEFFGLFTEDQVEEARMEPPPYEDDFNEY